MSNVDFAETFLDAAGVAVPADMQGRSLVPLLRGEPPRIGGSRSTITSTRTRTRSITSPSTRA